MSGGNVRARAGTAQQPSTETIFEILDPTGSWRDPSADLEPLKTKLNCLLAEVNQRERDQLVAPIREQDFKTRLRQMKTAYKRGYFEPGSPLIGATKQMHEYLVQIGKSERPEYWKARSLVYELNDIFGISRTINDLALKDGEILYNELLEPGKYLNPSEDERPLLREKVLFCACGGSELRRRGEVAAAVKLFESLLHFTKTRVESKTVPANGTQSILYFQLGSAFRVSEDYSESERMYFESLIYLGKRAETRGEEDFDDYIFSVRRQAKIVGTGFGWLNLTRGFLERADHAVTHSKALLAGSKDLILRAYIDMLDGAIKRCRAGTNKAELEKADKSLENARTVFRELGNDRSRARACWELALSKTAAGEYESAEKFVKEAAKYTRDRKWQVNIHILRSRIHRGTGAYEEALTEANLAIKSANKSANLLGSHVLLPLIDAYITLGEAQLFLTDSSLSPAANYAEVRGHFEKALNSLNEHNRRNPGSFLNPKLLAVLQLRIAQCYAREKLRPEAVKHFDIWDSTYRARVEHKWIHELANQVKNDIEAASTSFTISAENSSDWNYTENVAKLRQWLFEQALNQSGSHSAAADLLGVTRTTLYQWLAAEKRPKRARRNQDQGDQPMTRIRRTMKGRAKKH